MLILSSEYSSKPLQAKYNFLNTMLDKKKSQYYIKYNQSIFT